MEKQIRTLEGNDKYSFACFGKKCISFARFEFNGKFASREHKGALEFDIIFGDK